ncbi:choice-of-anchor A family protein [Pseudocolwellia sp. HL-MZ19]|uniref:choice-of-anchor A family protein n=1 Tax=unclassified Pseudocolwellia TaxID=2848178 RepID=UPI003CE92588
MTKLAVIFSSLCLTFASFVNASSFVLNDYNLIAIGDVNSSSLHVHGNAFIGGDLNAGNAEIGSRLNNTVALELAGDLDRNLKILGSNNTAEVSGTVTTDQNGRPSVNGNTIESAASVTQNTNLSAKAASIEAEINAVSNDYKNLTTTGEVLVKGQNQGGNNSITIDSQNIDANGFAVFELGTVTASGKNSYLVDNQNKDLEVIYNLSDDSIDDLSAIIINVPGTTIDFNNNKISANSFLSSEEGRSKVVWNFYEATTITLSSNFYGNILAPLAVLTSNSDIDGSVAVYGLSQQHSGQIHLPNADLTASTVSGPDPVTVPEPSTLILLAGALFFILRKKIQLA